MQNYRPEINGLRTIAVLSVIFFHADFSFNGWHPFTGGFLGVDVFFVISGYLITGILLKELKKGHLSLRSFYERRARRILPALVLVLISCLPFAWFWMTPTQLGSFSASLVATLSFVSNIYFLYDSNYFSQALQLKPLLHTWSLGVEEQFYILFPLLLLWLHRKQARILSWFIGLMIASLLLSEVMGQHFPSANFYLFSTRAWELLAGAILAHLEIEYGRKSHILATIILLPLALLGLCFSMTYFDGKTPQPGFVTLLPIAATMTLIWFSGKRDAVTLLLSSRPMVGIGLISYSLYLWHQPLFAFARIYAINSVPQYYYVILIAAAFLLATLSWHFVEQPFRKKTFVLRTPAWGGLFAGLACLVLMGVSGTYTEGFPSRMASLTPIAGVEVGYKDLSGVQCLRVDCVIGTPEAKPTIALVGDSHSGMLTQSLEKALKQTGQAAFVSANGDMYVDYYPKFYDFETKYNPMLKDTRAVILAPEVQTVILSARYLLRIENTAFDNQEGGVEFLPKKYFNGRTEAQKEEIREVIRSATMDLINRGKRVIIVYPVPEVGWHVPNTLQKLATRHLPMELTTSYDVYLKRSETITRVFDAIPDAPNVLKVRPDEIFCNTYYPNRCATHFGKEVFYFDDGHLSVTGADLLVAKIVKMANDKWGGLSQNG